MENIWSSFGLVDHPCNHYIFQQNLENLVKMKAAAGGNDSGQFQVSANDWMKYVWIMLYYYAAEECDCYIMYGFLFTQYRDRAKERRDKYGIPPPPEPRHKRPDLPVP